MKKPRKSFPTRALREIFLTENADDSNLSCLSAVRHNELPIHPVQASIRSGW